MNVAFDVDGTLFDYDGKPRQEIISILSAMGIANHSIYIWSGGGVDYARRRVETLGIARIVTDILIKNRTDWMDIAFDDQEVKLARVNIRV